MFIDLQYKITFKYACQNGERAKLIRDKLSPKYDKFSQHFKVFMPDINGV